MQLLSFKNRVWNIPKNSNLDLLSQIMESRSYSHNTPSFTILDASKLPNITHLTNMILEAQIKNHTIGIFGDYDADGLTSTFMWVDILKKAKIKCISYVPNRCDGYGASQIGIQKLEPADIILFLDCGSNSKQIIENIYKPVYIIDHHQITTPPNNAYIINPFLDDFNINTKLDYQQCCTAGLSFIILAYLRTSLKLEKRDIVLLYPYAAIGTIADVMHLNEYNKSIIKNGIELINTNPNSNIMILAKKLKITTITSSGLAFGIIPCINAAGRISDATIVLEFFQAICENIINEIAGILITLNNKRKEIEDETMSHAITKIDANKNCIIAKSEIWHAGIVGVIAGRLKTNLSKTAFIFYKSGDFWKGSARGSGVSEIIHKTIELGLAHSGGGHSVAGGIAIEEAKFDLWEAWVMNNFKEERELIQIDAIGTESSLIQLKELPKFGPFGPGNPQLKILIKNLWIAKVVPHNTHLRIMLNSGRSFFAFKTDYWGKNFKPGACLDILFAIEDSITIDDARFACP